MLRIFWAVVALVLCAPAAFACDGQTGKVIFEDIFTDDSGGWNFGEYYGLVLKAPGATLSLPAAEGGGSARGPLNQTFNATQGDYCTEMSFPLDATQLNAGIGIELLATDDYNFWLAYVSHDGTAALYKIANNKASVIWKTAANNSLVKAGPTDVNSVRAVVKNGTVTVIVNGQTVKSVRALIPNGELKFGFRADYGKPSATPVLVPVRSYKVTAVE